MARKILLADDSVTAQNMGRKILADAGYEVVTVNNGSAALKKVSEQHPDVIVLDVYMPGYSGLEVCQRLKEVGETARIPILLTVGKLEPFKPEEAKRVRADAFIVKPFEASELLSALTRLEDKIVPHAESSKPGRFGRAAAALDVPYDKTMAIEEDSGWKNRISFPNKTKEKTEDEEPVEIKPQPTLTESPMTESPIASSPTRTEDIKVDLGALAAAGLPKDVTPEEIAALAAAAARMKGKLGADAPAISEMTVVPPATFAENKPEVPAIAESMPTSQSMAGPGPIYAPEHKIEPIEPESVKDPIAVAIPAHEAQSEKKSADKPGEKPEAAFEPKPSETPAVAEASVAQPRPMDEPVTMAVPPAPVPGRWTAVAVTLAAEDSAVSLEQEMQKAFAAAPVAEDNRPVSASGSVVADAIPAAASDPEAVPTSTTASSEPESGEPESNESAAADLIAAAVTKPAEQSPAASSEVSGAALAESPEFASEAQKISAKAADSVIERQTVPETAVTAASEEAEAKPETRSAESISEVLSAPKTPAENESHETIQPVTESSRETPEVTQATSAVLETLKNLHHDAREAASDNGGSSSSKDSPKDDAAMAAAVGGKGPVEESKSEAESDPDVASIVDSVLADLRPKIVREISRKLGKK